MEEAEHLSHLEGEVVVAVEGHQTKEEVGEEAAEHQMKEVEEAVVVVEKYQVVVEEEEEEQDEWMMEEAEEAEEEEGQDLVLEAVEAYVLLRCHEESLVAVEEYSLGEVVEVAHAQDFDLEALEVQRLYVPLGREEVQQSLLAEVAVTAPHLLESSEDVEVEGGLVSHWTMLEACREPTQVGQICQRPQVGAALGILVVEVMALAEVQVRLRV